jgi:uncharacterized protein with gpF-like domain
LLFWPHGHKQIDKYPSTWFHAYLDSLAQSSVAKTYKKTPATTASPGIKNSKRTTKATRLDCDVAAGQTIYTVNAAGAADSRVREGSKIVAEAHVAGQGSWLKYDDAMCSAKPPPH